MKEGWQGHGSGRAWLTALAATAAAWLAVFSLAHVMDLALPDANKEVWQAVSGGSFWNAMARWDAGWYASIVQHGYLYTPGKQSNVAFFPLYPVLMGVGTPVTGNPYLGGYAVSFVGSFAAGWLLLRWVKLESGSEVTAQRALVLLLSFPTAFYLFAPYTESLFLALSLGAVYAGRERLWLVAGLCGMAAAATRSTGIVLWGVLGLMWLQAHGWYLLRVHRRANWPALLAALRGDGVSLAKLSLVPLGLGAYMIYLQVAFGDALAFVHVQEAWGRSFVGFWSILPMRILDVIGLLWRQEVELGDLVMAFDVGLVLLALGVVVPLWRRFGAPYALFVLLGALIPLSTGTWSLSRYVLVLFPVYLMLAEWSGGRPWLDAALRYGFALAQAGALTLYCNWYFVA